VEVLLVNELEVGIHDGLFIYSNSEESSRNILYETIVGLTTVSDLFEVLEEEVYLPNTSITKDKHGSNSLLIGHGIKVISTFGEELIKDLSVLDSQLVVLLHDEDLFGEVHTSVILVEVDELFNDGLVGLA
jgi:hypothetical protein